MKKSKLIRRIKIVFISVIAAFTASDTLAQNNSSVNPEYKNNPVWISMMEDPNVNYFEAVKAYDTYWKYHKKPRGEEEEMAMMQALTGDKLSKEQQRKKEEILREQEREAKESAQKKYSKKDQLAISEREYLKYQVKRFENWKLDVMPFVQEDGRILSEAEKQAIWLKQQEELKNSK